MHDRTVTHGAILPARASASFSELAWPGLPGGDPSPITIPPSSPAALATWFLLATRFLGDRHQPSKHRPPSFRKKNLPTAGLPNMRDLLINSSNQAFWEERIRKEVVTRATWNIRYGHKYPKEAPRTRKQPQQASSGSVLKAGPVPAPGSPVRKEAQAVWPETRGVQDQLFKPGGVQGDRAKQARGAPGYPAAQGRPENLEMRQPTPSTLKLLFQGISHEGQGRTLYLKERNRLIPEKKYKYPILSSWEYGWHIGDAKDFRTPAHAKTHPIANSFYTKNGIFHIPRRTDHLM
ncbi:protein ATP6V1FNB-like [Mesocricetus auratus]|uniref:Protein ATP6V1FNB-like n=1 Tax=Mesocricetus auratus TaxID=10036 RepID=A0ABM2WF16_MESAU|nr:protein ATP6V1FNB-like [Mesocricetus auratus]